MEISLVLREKGPGRLVYAIPLWYRLLMTAIAAILAGAIFVSGGGIVSWIIVGIAVLAALYEETWTLDKDKGSLTHRFGLLVAAKTIRLPLGQIEDFRLRAFIKGSNPGAPGAAGESARILSAVDNDLDNDVASLKNRQKLRRKAYITLICDDKEGGGLVLNTLPMRKADGLKDVAARLAQAAGVELITD